MNIMHGVILIWLYFDMAAMLLGKGVSIDMHMICSPIHDPVWSFLTFDNSQVKKERERRDLMTASLFSPSERYLSL